MISFFNYYNILHPSQYEFRKDISTLADGGVGQDDPDFTYTYLAFKLNMFLIQI